ncbi:hypothetical protein GOBAR_AA24729 [Gossypium barbadense]|uniref:Uncharacterized protein n=1 Tax=Gossypium barbadense TaxID=3634 RepID=A0A2P5WY26_GOSBA|nr:hypothetical protein GOBAR_AA24729 [Gossypium barbadense]
METRVVTLYGWALRRERLTMQEVAKHLKASKLVSDTTTLICWKSRCLLLKSQRRSLDAMTWELYTWSREKYVHEATMSSLRSKIPDDYLGVVCGKFALQPL